MKVNEITKAVDYAVFGHEVAFSIIKKTGFWQYMYWSFKSAHKINLTILFTFETISVESRV